MKDKPQPWRKHISHSRKWQELELQLWNVTSEALHAAPPSTVYASGHIHVVLRRSPAQITSPSPSPRRRADETPPRHFARSRVRGRHRDERV